MTSFLDNRWTRSQPLAWVAAAAGAIAIFGASSMPSESLPDSAWLSYDKALHGLVYALLGALWLHALSLGAALGAVAVVVRQEIVLAIMGGVFVVETLSVIIQVASFKLTGKRVFRMAPLHHHFELKGWAEPKVIVRFWIITVILVLIGLASLKIR